MSGKGPITADIRIAGDTIFVKFKNEYTALEKLMFNHIQLDSETSQGYQRSLEKQLHSLFSNGIKDITKDVTVVETFVRADVTNNRSFVIFVLDKNIEKMIEQGEVKPLRRDPK